MASTKIQNLPIKSPISSMKIPTGGFGDYSITVSGIGDFIIDHFNLATKEYVDTITADKEDKILTTGGNLVPVSQLSNVPDTNNETIDEVAQALLDRIEYVKDNFSSAPSHNELTGRSATGAHPSTSISHKSGTVYTYLQSNETDINQIKNVDIPFINQQLLDKQDLIESGSALTATPSLSAVPSVSHTGLNTALQALLNRTAYYSNHGNLTNRSDVNSHPASSISYKSSNVSDFLDNLNNQIIEVVPSVLDLQSYTTKKDNQIIKLESYFLNKNSGGGWLYLDKTDSSPANDVTTFEAFGGGLWKRIIEDQKNIHAVYGGVLFDDETDNTEAYRRICLMLPPESSLILDHGVSRTHYFSLPHFGCKIIGSDLTHSTIKLIDITDYIGWKDYNFFESFRVTGAGVFAGESYLFKDTRANKDTKADCDIFWKNCYFSEAEYISDGFGRGFKFDNCQDYNIRYAWLKIDFPTNFIPSGNDNDTLETAFRGFIFNNCRRHYSPSYFLDNRGYNAENIQGIQINNTWLEGGGRFVLGYLRDAVISGTIGYHKNAAWKYFELTGGNNINIVGNVFTKMRNGSSVTEAFLTSAKSINGLNISGNSFLGIDKELVRIGHNGEESSNFSITNNTYLGCFSNGESLFNITSGSIRNLTIKEKGIIAPSSSWIPVKRSTGLAVYNHCIDVTTDGSPYVHNFTRAQSLGSSKKQGIYSGTGNTLTQNIIVGYEPRNIRVTGSDGTVCILPYGTNLLANGLAIGTTQDFTATGNANKSGVTYFWETD